MRLGVRVRGAASRGGGGAVLVPLAAEHGLQLGSDAGVHPVVEVTHQACDGPAVVLAHVAARAVDNEA